MIEFRRSNLRWYRYLLKFRSVSDASGSFVSRGTQIGSDMIVGSGTRINGKIVVKGAGAVEFGKYCAVGADVRVITSNHATDVVNLQHVLARKIGSLEKREADRKGVSVGHNVWIGDAAIILPGVTVGNGAVLAAGTVIAKDVPAYAVVGGVPGKVLKIRLSAERIATLERSRWWDWTIDEMRQKREFFEA